MCSEVIKEKLGFSKPLTFPPRCELDLRMCQFLLLQ